MSYSPSFQLPLYQLNSTAFEYPQLSGSTNRPGFHPPIKRHNSDLLLYRRFEATYPPSIGSSPPNGAVTYLQISPPFHNEDKSDREKYKPLASKIKSCRRESKPSFKWTDDAVITLLTATGGARSGSEINWNNVIESMPGLNKIQLKNKWHRLKNYSIFTVEDFLESKKTEGKKKETSLILPSTRVEENVLHLMASDGGVSDLGTNEPSQSLLYGKNVSEADIISSVFDNRNVYQEILNLQEFCGFMSMCLCIAFF